jgi:hypothetical protein
MLSAKFPIKWAAFAEATIVKSIAVRSLYGQSMIRVSTDLQPTTVCPNCWHIFQTENVRWISVHESLLGDLRLGSDHQARFLPTRFDVSGHAIDIKGLSCSDLACPNCHLRIPRAVVCYKPFLVSIAGRPSCGKSFFLAAMTWECRKILPQKFLTSFTDADGECNRILNDYEEQLFFGDEADALVKLKKTDTTGDWYSTVNFDDQTMLLPKPFYFQATPLPTHPQGPQADKFGRLVCLYDNAGEFFLPGSDMASQPVTRHLGLAESWLFCFDPTQDPRFRKLLDGKSRDAQVTEAIVTGRQDTVLTEMVNRIRRYGNLGQKEKTNKPLIVICTKYDAWTRLLGFDSLPSPWAKSSKTASSVLNMTNIEAVSQRTKQLLEQTTPEIVAAASSITDQVYFIPVSATGTAAEKDEQAGDYKFRPSTLKPIWCEVPLLLALAKRAPGVIQEARKK